MRDHIKLFTAAIFATLVGVPSVWAADLFVAENSTNLGYYLSVAGGWNYADSDKFHLSSQQISGEIRHHASIHIRAVHRIGAQKPNIRGRRNQLDGQSRAVVLQK